MVLVRVLKPTTLSSISVAEPTGICPGIGGGRLLSAFLDDAVANWEGVTFSHRNHGLGMAT